MITENIKTYTDEEIINLINKIVMGEVEAELADLKAILAEASGRKLEKNYINIIAERIREKIQPQQVEQKRKTEIKQSTSETQKFNFDEIYSTDFEDDEEEEDENYPVLSFLAGLYKVFAWIFFGGTIVTGAIISALFVAHNVFTICAVMLGALLAAIILLLAFLGASENVRLKIDIEKHLRELK